MKKTQPLLSIEELQNLYRMRKTEIRKRLQDFKAVPASEYFYELAYCLLTPQSSAVNAEKAIHAIRASQFHLKNINPEPLLHQEDFYIRFHKTKAKHLLAAKEQFPIISEQLTAKIASSELRLWLVNNVKGLGWKEASHFLRNIGHRNLAILDRHILRNLVRVGVLKEVPRTMSSKVYLEIEEKFLKFSDKAGIPMDELDLVFWSMETGKVLK